MDGNVIDKPNDIKVEAVSYFQHIFKEEHLVRPTFNGLCFNKLSPTDCSILVAPFTHDEINAAVSYCDSQKAPGPNDFNFSFIRSSWEVIKHDIYSIVEEFWTSCRLLRGCNSAFIALIPEIKSPKDFKDLRPISMVRCLYKIIAKLMEGRLLAMMDHLIGPF